MDVFSTLMKKKLADKYVDPNNIVGTHKAPIEGGEVLGEAPGGDEVLGEATGGDEALGEAPGEVLVNIANNSVNIANNKVNIANNNVSIANNVYSVF